MIEKSFQSTINKQQSSIINPSLPSFFLAIHVINKVLDGEHFFEVWI